MTLGQKCWRAFLIGWFGGFAANEVMALAHGDFKGALILAVLFLAATLLGGIAVMVSTVFRRCACGHTLDMHGCTTSDAGFWPGRGACWKFDCRCDRSIRVPAAKVGR